MIRNIFAKGLDDNSLAMIEQLNTTAWCKNNDYAIMPDAHAGRDCLVGLTMKLQGVVDPRWIGADIGCGVLVTPFPLLNDEDLVRIDKFLSANRTQLATKWNTPHTRAEAVMNAIKESAYKFGNETINTLISSTEDEMLAQLGTLGGGNHFIELGNVAGTDHNFLTVHTGSRHFGQNILSLMLNRAESLLDNVHKVSVQQTIKYCKENGQEKLIEEKLKTLRQARQDAEESNYVLAGDELLLYLQLQSLAVDYAIANRALIVNRIEQELGIPAANEPDIFVGLDLPHNYIDIVDGGELVLHKGTIKAHAGDPIAIPLNMRDGIVMAVAKGNADALYSCPHGAGRVMSRKKAKNEFTLDDFKEQMSDVKTSSVCQETLDEHPDAYKSVDYTTDNGVGVLYDVVGVIKPIYNFKCF